MPGGKVEESLASVSGILLAAYSQSGKTLLTSNLMISLHRNTDRRLAVIGFDAKAGIEFTKEARALGPIYNAPTEPLKIINVCQQISRLMDERAAYKARVDAVSMNSAWRDKLENASLYKPTLLVFDEYPVISDMRKSKDHEKASEELTRLLKDVLGRGASLGYHALVCTQTARSTALDDLGGMQDNFSVRIVGYQATLAMAQAIGLKALHTDRDFKLFKGVFYLQQAGGRWIKFRSHGPDYWKTTADVDKGKKNSWMRLVDTLKAKLWKKKSD